MTLTKKISWHLQQLKWSAVKLAYSIFIRKVKVNGVFLPVKKWYSNRVFQFILNGEYERPEMLCIKKNLVARDRVVEFGSGLGLLSAYCASIVGNEQVHTFEGNEQLEALIKETYSLNKVAPSITFALIGKEEKDVSFNVEPRDVWASSSVSKSATSHVVVKKQLAANKIIQQHQPNFLIIDIEGAEQDLLPTLDMNGINKFQIEFHPLVYGDAVMNTLIAGIKNRGFVNDTSEDTQTFYFHKNNLL